MKKIPRSNGAVEVITRTEWIALGERLYGPDRNTWEFRCVACGHVQSGVSVKARSPSLKVSEWIWCDCEGRYTRGVGCDWTLFGLFTIHKRAVVPDEGGIDGQRQKFLSVLGKHQLQLAHPGERGINIISMRNRACTSGGVPVFIFAAETGL